MTEVEEPKTETFGDNISEKASSTITQYSQGAYAQIGGALSKFFLSLFWEAAKAYWILAIKLVFWAVLPLMSIFGFLLFLSRQGTFGMGFSLVTGLLIVWQLGVYFFNGLNISPVGIDSSKTSEASHIDPHIRVTSVQALKKTFIRFYKTLRQIFNGQVSKNEFIGFAIRLFGLITLAMYSLPGLSPINLEVIGNEIYYLCDAALNAFILQPIPITVSYLISFSQGILGTTVVEVEPNFLIDFVNEMRKR